MKHIAVLILAAMSVLVCSFPALAHRPYFTQIEEIRLPNGEIGEVRLINGDGVIVTDPARPLIIDASGRLIGRGKKAHSIVMACDGERRCCIVDIWTRTAYDLEPSTFRQGAVQPAVTSGDRTEDWALEDGEESWGFTTREATSREMLDAIFVQAQRYFIGLIAIAIVAGLGAFPIIPPRLSIKSKLAKVFVQACFLFVGIVFYLVLVAITFWLAIAASGVSFELWFLSVALGTALGWLVRWISRQQSQTISAA